MSLAKEVNAIFDDSARLRAQCIKEAYDTFCARARMCIREVARSVATAGIDRSHFSASVEMFCSDFGCREFFLEFRDEVFDRIQTFPMFAGFDVSKGVYDDDALHVNFTLVELTSPSSKLRRLG